MDFDYSSEQTQLKDEARRFLSDRCPPAAVRRVLEDPALPFDRDLHRSLGDMGWLGAAAPEAYGGLGLGRVEQCALAEELGRALAPAPVASSIYFAAEALLLAGSEEQKRARLPGLLSGARVGCLAAVEGPGRLSAAGVRARVEGGRLTGVKAPVTDGGGADVAVVLAQEADGPSLFLVELAGEGVAREPLQTVDPSRKAARLVFDRAPAERLGAAGRGLETLEAVYDRAAVLLAFEQIGGADRCLEMARDYALQRHAFGRPIGGFQAIKHKLADVYVKNQVARSNAYYGAWALNASAAELPLAAAAARVAASEAFWFAAKENVQTHGGMGFTWEADCHLYFRRAQQLALTAGSPKAWRDRLVSSLERRNAA